MYDTGWCSGCGKNIGEYREEGYCGECSTDYANADINKFIEYMNLHLISLMQDSEKLEKEMDTYEEFESNEWQALEIEDISNNGQIIATQHLLSVARDMLNTTH